MIETSTGKDKIKAGLPDNIVLGHKTGSSDRLDDGTKIGDNDTGVIYLPNGKLCFLAIFIKDSRESDQTNTQIIADIARIMKRSFTYIILLYLLTIGCSGKSASVIGGANGSTEIIVADCDTDTILTGNDLEKFDSLFNAWVNNYNTNPITRLSSNTNDAKKLEQFPQLLNMGKKIIPCIITRLPDKNLFWTLTLYDELQDIDSLKSFDYTRGEQFRAQETLRKYVEAKLHKKKRVFNSDQEKIKAIRELAKEYGWEEDSTLSPREKDSILLNLDYEITEETFKFYKNGNNEE